MQTPQPENVAAHFFWIALPIILATLAGQWASYRASRKRGEAKDKERGSEQLLKDNRLAILLDNYRLHDHPEKSGPLHAENVRYPRGEDT